jgi:hypothetical protein
VFQLTPPSEPGGSWTENVLYNFTGSGDAFGGILLIDKSGALYSTTQNQVFKLTPPQDSGADWTFTVLHSDVATFITVDLVGKTGALFGTTLGPNAFFELTQSGNEKVLVEMGDIYPLPGLAAGPGGALYGGNFGGEVFKLTPPSQRGGKWTIAFVISSCFNNGMPTLNKKGTIYGYDVGICGPQHGAVYQVTQ